MDIPSFLLIIKLLSAVFGHHRNGTDADHLSGDGISCRDISWIFFKSFFCLYLHHFIRLHGFTGMMGMPCLGARLLSGLFPVVCDLFAVDAFRGRQGRVLIVMVHLCRELHDKSLCIFKLCGCFIIILPCCFPFFIQFSIPLLQACGDVQEFGNDLFKSVHFFFVFLLDILQHIHPLPCYLFAGEGDSIPFLPQLFYRKVQATDNALVICAQLHIGIT